jgi:hypothetical protein
LEIFIEVREWQSLNIYFISVIFEVFKLDRSNDNKFVHCINKFDISYNLYDLKLERFIEVILEHPLKADDILIKLLVSK